MHAPSAAAPFFRDGGPTGVLLCHGFTGSPASMRPWAEQLAAAGHTVHVPLLPGHGTSWREMNLTRWPDWFAAVENALLRLDERCDSVVVAGLSMGGGLALRLAQVHPSAVSALVLVNPSVASADRRLRALPLLQYVVPSLAGLGNDIAKPGQDEHAYPRTPLRALHSLTHLWKVVVRDLPAVTQPLLMFRSATDHVVDGSGAPLIIDGVSSADVTEVVLHRSYHVATLDYDADTIFTRSAEFIERVNQRAKTGAQPNSDTGRGEVRR
ncbi:alpha/beta hydrolase [Phytoactinopolyspora halotolerans]|uniref:Alpha/beta fold hydrolase n=1 Tax=Phytoactinopolyspora halotolerans TaxID=1981512 RepID=A0A6L9SB57_9ACTN|nr:alpha/beta fold hydrolase [Phytoactinopolyspora halotolerans]NEE01802.1 alpha/beta fold hydrolase [Phytoactinopolyspora halotolerans]